MNDQQAQELGACLASGGVAVFPADTVYGLACDPENAAAVERLYELKGRPPSKPAAVMFFELSAALAVVDGARVRAALEGLLPGAVTVLLPNPERRFPLACGPDPETLGLRVPALGPATVALSAVRWPVMQSSANPSGGADARRISDIDPAIVAGVDLVLDAGDLDGTASTV